MCVCVCVLVLCTISEYRVGCVDVLSPKDGVCLLNVE